MQKATLETVQIFLINVTEIPMETFIAIFDVVGRYTNISHTFGIEAVRYFLLKYKEDIHPRFNIPFILESIDFIL